MKDVPPIKVAHILKDMVIGGIQTLLLDMLSYYEKTGQTYIFIAIGNGEAEELFRNKGYNCYFLKKKLPFLDPVLVWKIRRILISEKIDIVHAHHTSEGIAAYLAHFGTATKCVQTYHVAPHINNSRDEWAFKKLAARMAACISPSRSQLKSLETAGYPVSKFTVVHNGISPERLEPRNRRDIRQELGLDETHLLLGMVGNFYNDTRDQLTICKALPQIFDRFPNARFVFFGGHQNESNPEPERYRACVDFCLKAGIADKVFFPGLESDAGAIYSSLDLFVYSSLHDTFGMAVVEAMICGIPVICNDLPVLMEVTGQNNVMVFPSGNVELLALEIISALENPDNEAKALAKNAREFALSRYHVKNHVNALNSLYTQLASSI